MTTEPGPTHRERRGVDTDRIGLGVLVVLGAVLGALDDAAPTGIAAVDGWWRALAAAVIVLCGAYAPPLVWVASAVAAAVSSSQPSLLILGALTIVVATVAAYRFPTFLSGGAAVGVSVSWIVFRLPHDQFVGAATLVAMAVAAIVVLAAWYWGPVWLGTSLGVMTAALAVAFLGGAAVLGLTVFDARGDLNEATDLAQRSEDLFREGDEQGAERTLRQAVDTLERVDRSANSRWVNLTRALPVIGRHTAAIQTLTGAGTDTAAAALTVLEQLDRGALTIVDGAVDLQAVRSIEPAVASLAALSGAAVDDLDLIETQWLVPPARDAITDALAEIEDLATAAQRASKAVKLAPPMLGIDGPRTYLVLFATPAELRGSTGLIGNWATVEANDGTLSLAGVGRVEDLVAELEQLDVRLSEPADYLARYGPNSPETQFHDITLSPNFPDVAAMAAQLFEAATGTEIDSVLLADPEALAALVGLAGPIQLGGRTMTAANVADFLLTEQYAVLGEESERLLFLEQLLQFTFLRLFAIEFPDPWDLDEVFQDVIAEDRLVISSVRPSEQALLEELGLGGEFPERTRPGDDLIGMVTQNGGQNKIDTFLERSLTYTATLDRAADRIAATVQIELTNSVPDLNLADAVVGSNDQGLPLGTNRLTLVVYSPHTLVSATVDGVEQGFQVVPEFGLLSFARRMDIAPGQTVVVELQLEGDLDAAGGYRLLVPVQASVLGDRLTVSVADTIRESLTTAADQIFE